MKTLDTQKGFTLVELAIVMTIIGLLIGGILKGQELMENARVTSTISQVKAYEAATTTFRDSFNAFPGDMPNAQNRVPNCNANCDPAVGVGLAGNSIIGAPGWAAGGYVPQLPAGGMANPPAAVGEETQLYWVHLLQADLVSGVTDQAIRAVTVPAWGVTHPSAKIGGGFVVGYGDGTPGLGMPVGIVGPAGTTLVMANAPNDQMVAAAPGQLPLSPSRAAQIDRKMDDGKPGAGFVQAWGTQGAAVAGANICYDNVIALAPNYFEANTQKDCGLIFRIQG